MKRHLLYSVCCLVMLVLAMPMTSFAAATEVKMKASTAELKKMGVFVSNFTELGFWEIERPDRVPREDLVRFGIWHNYTNNFKSRVVAKKSKYGTLAIDGKWVAESVKKYFNVTLQHGSVMDSDPPYYYDGKQYLFDGADGEAAYQARVKEAFQRKDGTIVMVGEIYNPDGDSEDPVYPFKAVAKPYTFAGKATWAIVSLHTDTDTEKNEE